MAHVPFPESDLLHARARAFVRAFEAGAPMPEPFDALACDLARFQAAHTPGYARLCAARGVDVSAMARAGEAPAVPTDTFKLTRVATFPERDAAARFRTSGTTIGQRGTHAMRDTATYDAAALAFGRWALVPPSADAPLSGPSRVAGHVAGAATGGLVASNRLPIVVLGPTPEEAPDSSLVHMMALFVRELGVTVPDDATYFLRDDVLDVAGLDERIAQSMTSGDEAVLLLGTSFALVHLLDAIGDATFRLPPRSRVMQTGGFKGRSREVDGPTLRRELARAFHIDERSIVSEYGMTELSSQFYEVTLRDDVTPHGVYREPPWARVVPVDPETLAPVADGEIGIARIEDLMNVDSSFAVLAADRVRRIDGGFELLGRAPGAAPRGCSIAIDEMLGR